jgi:hypothetical protein
MDKDEGGRMKDEKRQEDTAEPLTREEAARGPLVVSEENPRYFQVAGYADRRAVYLTGSHVWNNFQDGLGPGLDCAETPEQNDFSAYLKFLKDHGHNFIRLWRWEQFKSQAGGSFHLCMTPQPWPRTGPGAAADGKPQFDLSRFDPAYFDRLRERVAAAGSQGIYVSVMLFDGFCLHLCPPPDNVAGHPFASGNNVNGVRIRSIVDYQVVPLDPHVRVLQEAYLRKVVDTVHDLPNVLYEVANESSGMNARSVRLPDGTVIPTRVGDSTGWQYWVIHFVREYEQQRGYDRHPIGMTMQFPVRDRTRVNEPLFNGPADWVSPGFDDEVFTAAPGGGPSNTRWFTDPPANDGRKVVLTDTDHYSPEKADALWAWKSFLRGHNSVLMDYGIIDLVHPLDPALGIPPYAANEAARYAMGDTLRYARQVDLIHMTPHGELSSTGYALAKPGWEYIVLQPIDTTDPFTLSLSVGVYAVRWYDVTTRETRSPGKLTVERDGTATFRAPLTCPGPSVLHLKLVSGVSHT